jgi:hypothetical protein
MLLKGLVFRHSGGRGLKWTAGGGAGGSSYARGQTHLPA